MSLILSFSIFLSFFILILLTLAAFGAELGFRQKYVRLLLKIFEYGRKKIEAFKLEEESEEEDEETVIAEQNSFNNSVNNSVISKQGVLLVPDPQSCKPSLPRNRSFNSFQKEFNLSDALAFLKAGVEAIIDDEVTQRFDAQELPSWNLLTRTNKNYAFINIKLTIIWFLGFLLRYFVLFPIRFFIMIVGVTTLIVCTALLGYIPDGRIKRFIYWHTSVMCFRILSRCFSAIIEYHDRQNRAKPGGICVANHTSPIDVIILACDNAYTLVGQSHGGFLGVLQRALARASSHIWFDRFEMKDREAVAKRLRDHVENLSKMPILIFPEGTCINNTSVMMFKKGCFEVGGIIYPVAIKYDPKFGDPFWNSSRYGYMSYLIMMMTSWAIVCDVWYLPPMIRQPGETAIDFANRVKSEIARKGGLVDLDWDGQLKRLKVKPEWKAKQQEEYSLRIKGE